MAKKAEFSIGIDLGTSTSEVAIYRNGTTSLVSPPGRSGTGRSVIVPSIVAVDHADTIKVGEVARAYLGVEGRCIQEIKRLMGSDAVVPLGDKQYKPQEISAFILRQLKDNAEKALGCPVTDVVLSVPANFKDAARQATKDAAELAGLNVVRLINEPTAAALAYGINNLDKEEHILVFDFGGGTLDISILEMVEGIIDVKVSHGDVQLGGKDIDEALATYLFETVQKRDKLDKKHIGHYNAGLLKSKAREIKERLSQDETADVRIDNAFSYKGEPYLLECSVSRAEFRKCIADILARAKRCLEETMQLAKISPESISRVVFVGGTTYIPDVREIVEDFFGRGFEFNTDINPDEAVARGAAIQAAIARGLISSENSLILTDVCPFTLGTRTLTIINNQVFDNAYDPLIMRNTKIPYSIVKEYSLVHPEQQSVEVSVYQGEGLSVDSCEFVHSGEIVNIPPSTDGDPHKVNIEFSYDINGIITVKATIPKTKQELELVINKSENRMDDREKEEALERIEAEWQDKAADSELGVLIKTAEDLLKRIPDGEEKAALKKQVARVKKAVVADGGQDVDALETDLTDMLIDMGTKYPG